MDVGRTVRDTHRAGTASSTVAYFVRTFQSDIHSQGQTTQTTRSHRLYTCRNWGGSGQDGRWRRWRTPRVVYVPSCLAGSASSPLEVATRFCKRGARSNALFPHRGCNADMSVTLKFHNEAPMYMLECHVFDLKCNGRVKN